MKGRNFRQMLETQWSQGKFVCVGLDSDVWQIPKESIPNSKYLTAAQLVLFFNRRIVDATYDLVCAYKPNVAFYEKLGDEGSHALRETVAHIHRVAPDVPVILDAKRADIGNTNKGYVAMAFDFLQADAITVNPYLGAEALQPFLAQADKGIIVLCCTSNSGAGEFQDLIVSPSYEEERRWNLPSGPRGEQEPTRMPLYQYVAYRVSREWNKNGNCALVVGATYPEKLREVRVIIGDMPILLPAVGFQQKDIPLEVQVKQVVSNGADSRKRGMIINSASGIIFAPDPREATLQLHYLINQCREKGEKL